jgi:hypothetical protein
MIKLIIATAGFHQLVVHLSLNRNIRRSNRSKSLFIAFQLASEKEFRLGQELS